MILKGFKIYVSPHCVTHRWIFPKEAFFEWEDKDEWFGRKYGVGHEGPPEPCCYQVMGTSWLMHPTIFEQLKKEHPGLMASESMESIFGGIPMPNSLLTTV